MANFRIIKYNPTNLDENNNIISDEWTSFSDIGKDGNVIVTFEDYLKVEKAYIDTTLDLMKYNGISDLTIKEIEKYDENIEWKNTYDDFNSKEAVKLFKRLKDGMTIKTDTLEKVCKLILREYLWCKLEYKDIFYVHFGFDYYMYIGCQNVGCDFIKDVRDRGIYVDEFVSPYLD